MNVWIASMASTPQPSSMSNERLERFMTVTPRRISSTYTASSSTPNTMPSCSQMTAKIKSL